MAKKNTDHVTMGNNSLRCQHCGDEQMLAFPMAFEVMAAASKAYEKLHARCEPRDHDRYKYTNPEEWLHSWDTGVSSKSIFYAFKGYGIDSKVDAPYDGADFARCYRLLKVAPPSWREQFVTKMSVYEPWKAIAPEWEKLERLYEVEAKPDERGFPAKGADAPKLYEMICKLRGRA